MEKAEILAKIIELQKLQRELEDIAKELNIGDIKNDKIYVAIVSYKNSLSKIVKEN
jgi:hypothetical protein